MSSSHVEVSLTDANLPEALHQFSKPLIWSDPAGRVAVWNLSAAAEFPNLARGTLLSEVFGQGSDTTAPRLTDLQYVVISSAVGAPERVFQLHYSGWSNHEGGQQILLIDQTHTQRKLAAMDALSQTQSHPHPSGAPQTQRR